jgi:hypothetical protein
MPSRSLIILCTTLLAQNSFAWSPLSLFLLNPTCINPAQLDEESSCKSRRNFMTAATMQICLLGGSALPASAQDATIYKSGKTPVVPGQKPKDKSDVKGTKKDPDFLRSIADCRNQCQSTNGSDGFAKSKEDCLSECQDICCTTYEQW